MKIIKMNKICASLMLLIMVLGLQSQVQSAATDFDLGDYAGISTAGIEHEEPQEDWLLADTEDLSELAQAETKRVAQTKLFHAIRDSLNENSDQFDEIMATVWSRFVWFTTEGKRGCSSAITGRVDAAMLEELIFKAASSAEEMPALVGYLMQILQQEVFDCLKAPTTRIESLQGSDSKKLREQIASIVNDFLAAMGDLISTAETKFKLDVERISQIWQPVRRALEPYHILLGQEAASGKPTKRSRDALASRKKRSVRFRSKAITCSFEEEACISENSSAILQVVATKQ
jgi:hypothetical protein